MGSVKDPFTRAKRRKSAWNLLLFPIFVSSFATSWYASTRLLGEVYRAYHPTAEFALLPDTPVSIVLALAPFFGWYAPSMIVANAIVWLVPRARRALDTEAQGRPETQFAKAMHDLWVVARVLTPVALGVALVAAIL